MAESRQKSIFENFIDGARRGWEIGIKSMLPSIVMAYVLIQILTVTGIIDVLAKVFTPVMGIFGLPGIAVVALVAGFFSKGGGCAAAAALYTEGSITEVHATMLLPAIILFGGLLGQWVRIVVLAGVPPARYLWMFVIAAINSVLALYVMKIILSI
ncbi:MAG: nucleoside recognition domain-containing protein [bacterium]